MSSSLHRVCFQLAKNCPRSSRQYVGRPSSGDTHHHITHIRRTASPSLQEFHQCRTYANHTETSSSVDEQGAASSISDRDNMMMKLLEEGEVVDESEISSTGHSELEQHREVRELSRVAAWDMPLLSKFAKQFTPPDKTKLPLRWRYLTYFGEAHPASRKVVVEFKIADLGLTPKQSLKLKKLVGVRYNPDTDTVRMASDSFDVPARNKRYLGDTIKTLIAEATDPNADSFEDVPLDLRHHKPKPNYTFPEEWKITPERRAQIEESRKRKAIEEAERAEQGLLPSGAAVIEADIKQKTFKAEQAFLIEAQQGKTAGKSRSSGRQTGR